MAGNLSLVFTWWEAHLARQWGAR